MKIDKFKKLKQILGKNSPKATAEKEASEDPKKFMEKMKNLKIGKKGIAF